EQEAQAVSGEEQERERLEGWIRAAWENGDAWLRAVAVRASRCVPGFDRRLFEPGGSTPGPGTPAREDPADALYLVVEGRVRLATGDRPPSEVGPGEAFGTWALVDDSRRGQSAVAVEDGLLLSLRRADFYEEASGDVTLLQEVIRVLAKRLRAL